MTELTQLQTPPNSVEAEQAVLGSLLVHSSEEVDEVLGLLNAKDFYRKDHQIIYECIKQLLEKQDVVDVLTVGENLVRTEKYDQAGGNAYLGELANQSPATGNTFAYAELVRQRSIHRQLIDVGSKISKLGFKPSDKSTQDLLDQAEQLVFDLAQQKQGKSFFQALNPVIQNIVKRIDQLSSLKTSLTGFATGFTRIDQLTNGLQRGDLIVIAGRPSMGKTTFATNIAEYIATHQGDYQTPEDEPPVIGFFSMEMGADQLVMRMIASLGSIKLSKLRSGKMENNEWTSLLSITGPLRKRKILIDDQSGITAHTLRGRARRLKRDNPNLSLIIIDYLQLLNSDQKRDNRTAEVTEITRILKEMARELDIPVIVLSQLNRMVESRKDYRPMMSDLRESGSIEQDADIIMFVHREEVYRPEDENLKGKAVIFLAKQRNGETGIINLQFSGEFTRFENPLSDEQRNQYEGITPE